TFLGVMPEMGREVERFLTANSSPRSLLYVVRRLLRHGWETARYGRAVTLTGGNALIARLLASALDAGVGVRTRARATRLTQAGGRVTGAVVNVDGEDLNVVAARGVVLAAGGFSHDAALRDRFLAAAGGGEGHASPMTREHDGDGLRL